MPTPLAERTIALVKATAPAFEAHGLAITRRMYERMFENGSIRDLFDQSHHGETGSQPKALTAAILAYARNIDNLGALAPVVERIAQRHVSLSILPEHYPYVADALLRAIGDVLGEAATPEVLAAWGEAYWFLADTLAGRERQLYGEAAASPGGWSGWRDFEVAARHRESDGIASFVLRPADGGAVLRHRPGQYLTFRPEIPGHPSLKRSYSISSAPGDASYRITVKREPGGVVSNWLHDSVGPGARLSAAPPAGGFFLGEAQDRPVVLLSAGVGVTPMVSMLEAVASGRPDLPTHFVHGARDGAAHAMGRRVRELARARDNIAATIFYAAPRAGDVAGRDYDRAGRVSLDWLRRHTPLGEADYFLCGPTSFLRDFVTGLAAAGVPAGRVHYEFFGPADELRAAAEGPARDVPPGSPGPAGYLRAA